MILFETLNIHSYWIVNGIYIPLDKETLKDVKHLESGLSELSMMFLCFIETDLEDDYRNPQGWESNERYISWIEHEQH